MKFPIKTFDVEINGRHYGINEVVFTDENGRAWTPKDLFDWVPVLYQGPLKDANVYELAKGNETVSGKGLHIKEGCVVVPEIPRKSTKGGFNIHLKVINPAYKESGEEFN